MSKAIKAALLAAFVLELGGRAVFWSGLIEPDRLDHDIAWRLAWARRAPAMAAIYPMDRPNPTRGWEPRPNYAGDGVTTNSKGLRGWIEYSYERPAGLRRVAVLGDSFVFGEEVKDAETFAHWLQLLDPRSEYLNFGVHGYGHDQMLLYLREEVLKYSPDLVVVGFVDADMSRNLLTFRDHAKPRFRLKNGALVLENSPVPSLEASRREERWRSRFLDLVTLAVYSYRRPPSDAVTAAILDAMAKEARVLFVHLPDSSRPGGPFLRNYCASRKADCLDLTGLGREIKFLPGGHWDAAGHGKIARALQEKLRP